MSIRARCDDCGRIHEVPDTLAGRRVKCRDCGNVYAVPATTTAAARPPGGKICTICGQDVANSPRVKDTQGRYYCHPCYQSRRHASAPRAQAAPHPDVPEAAPAHEVDLLDIAAGLAPVAVDESAQPIVAIAEPERPVAEPAPRLRSLLGYAPRRTSRSTIGKMIIEGPVSRLILVVGYGISALIPVVLAARVSILAVQSVLLGEAIAFSILLFVIIPLAMWGVRLAAKLTRFEPNEPLYYIMAVVYATPSAINLSARSFAHNLGRPEIAYVAGVLSLPLTFLVFHFACGGKILQSIVGFIFAILVPILAIVGVLLFLVGLLAGPRFL